MNFNKYILLLLSISAFNPSRTLAQDGNIDGKTIVTVKNYKPVLADAVKLSDEPEGDTSTMSPSKINYAPSVFQLQTFYETPAIKALKVKDEPITKLYKSFLKLGLGNYEKFLGELYVNSLRSKNYQAGLHLKHFSGDPNLAKVGNPKFGNNIGSIYGKYFLDKAVISATIDFDQQRLQYYGFNPEDTVVDDKAYKQRFNYLNFGTAIHSTATSKDDIKYNAAFNYGSLKDKYGVLENELLLKGGLNKNFENFTGLLDVSLNFFKKSDANFQNLTLDSNRDRNIIRIAPSLFFVRDKMLLTAGISFETQKDRKSSQHLFPNIQLFLPIADQVLSFYAKVTGGIQKNNFNSIRLENPFITSAIVPLNSVKRYELSGGLQGNINRKFSFVLGTSYGKVSNMQFFINDTLRNFPPSFNVLYDDASVVNFHGELGYKSGSKFNAILMVDQFSFNPERLSKAYQRPNTFITFQTKYNLRDKFTVGLELFAYGAQYARVRELNSVIDKKINGFTDINLLLEYRYSKVLSVFANFNNLGFGRYFQYYGYPSERFNALAGISFSF